MGKAVRISRTNKPSFLSHSTKGVGRPGHGSPGNRKDPAGKENGCKSHRRGAGNCATPATHAGRQADREVGIGVTRESVRSHRPTMLCTGSRREAAGRGGSVSV